VIDDVLGIIVLSVFIAFAAPQVAAQQTLVGMLAGPGVVGKLLLTLLFMALFFTLAIWFGARAFRAVFAAAERLHASHAIPATALLLLLLFAFGAVYLGQVAAITGAYIAGVFIARTPYRERVEHGIHPFTYAFFVPIFFISIGLEANARALQGGNWLFVLVIVLVAILTKIAGCGLGARMTGFTRPAALRVGLGMISRGEVGLIIALIGRDAGLLSTNAYATMVIMVLVTTMVTPLFLRVSFPPAAPNATEVYECVIGMETSEDTEGL
jgi:Kef-type K+ transport system membrane component KefB